MSEVIIVLLFVVVCALYFEMRHQKKLARLRLDELDLAYRQLDACGIVARNPFDENFPVEPRSTAVVDVARLRKRYRDAMGTVADLTRMNRSLHSRLGCGV